ncbi:hypothetical protein D1007_46246 [Hordeum vulgare]|nr:hypothetical protein D1007_46246 [Hordeum vulgare]
MSTEKEYIKLPHWTPPPPPPLASELSPPPPSPPRSEPTPPPVPPPASEPTPSHPPPPASEPTPPPPHPPPPTHKQPPKRAATAPAASSIIIGGKRFIYGPSLKDLPKLPYENSIEENTKIVAAYNKEQLAPKRPPPKDKLDPVKVKRCLDALHKPQTVPLPLPSHYERTIQNTYGKAK